MLRTHSARLRDLPLWRAYDCRFRQQFPALELAKFGRLN